MNCKQANEKSIVSFLGERGFEPIRTTGASAWYLSPIHTEKTPSFKVNTSRNMWFDFGTGVGGQLVNLVMQLYGVDMPEALTIISGQNSLPRSIVTQDATEKTSSIQIEKVKKLENAALLQYLESRRIPAGLAKRYLKECYYQVREGRYFALAFQNDKGGYELRSKYAKVGSSPKAITTVRGADQSTVAVFEGFFDFLSALVYFKRSEPVTDSIILNSITQASGVLGVLSEYERVNLFLDNDHAGESVVELIQSEVPGAVDWSDRYYPRHKDFNELLCSQST